MFLDSSIECYASGRNERRWATFMSFAFQAIGVTTFLLMSLFQTGTLPPLQSLEYIVFPPPAKPVQLDSVGLVRGPANLVPQGMVAPSVIPVGIHNPTAPEPAVPVFTGAGEGPGVEGSLGLPSNASINPVMISVLKPPPMPPKPLTQDKPLIMSHLDEGMLLRRVEPEYPVSAKIARIQGAVVLTAVIDKSGSVEQLRAIDGHPLLVKAAMDAVRQWRYRPYVLDGRPWEVETQITVIFHFSEQ